MPPPLPEPERRASPPPETPEESPNFFDERFDFEEPFDLLESVGTAGGHGQDDRRDHRAGGKTPPQTAAPTTTRTWRRATRVGSGRDGRRRPLGRLDLGLCGGFRARVRSGTARTDRPTAGRATNPRPAGLGSGVRSVNLPAAAEIAAIRAAGAAEERPRDRDRAAPPKLPEDDEVEVDVFADDELELGEGDQSEADQPARLGFRGIPTWEEVLGMLIDKNLEARSKRSGRRPAPRPRQSRRPR